MAINIVLFEPEIPQNTGNILRTCVAAGCRLHLIEPFGFDLDDKRIRRSTTNHLPYADVRVYRDVKTFFENNAGTFYYMTRYGQRPHSNVDFSTSKDPIYILFGKESTGLPLAMLRDGKDRCFRIPMSAHARSLNVANSVAIVTYEAMRQRGYPGLYTHEVQKGKDYLESYDL